MITYPPISAPPRARALPASLPPRGRSRPPEVAPPWLILSTECGFGREGLARGIAFYKRVKCVEITLEANIVCRGHGRPDAPVPAGNPRFA